MTKHKTFSLLPFQLIPYWKFSILFLYKVMKLRCEEMISVHCLQQKVFDLTLKTGDGVELSAARIYGFKMMIDQAITKLLTSGYYPEFETLFMEKSRLQRIRIFMDISAKFYCHKVLPPIRGPCALSYDYYLTGGGYLRNQYFLFGTPSQFVK